MLSLLTIPFYASCISAMYLGNDKREPVPTESAASQDHKLTGQYTQESQGYFLAKYSGLHEFTLHASAEASLQFGVGNRCVDVAGNSLTDELVIRTSRNNGYSAVLQAGLYYPLQIVLLVSHDEVPFLNFEFKEPHGQFTKASNGHIYQVGFDFGEDSMKPVQPTVDDSFLHGCDPLNWHSEGFTVTSRSTNGAIEATVDDFFFVEDYKIYDELKTDEYIQAISFNEDNVVKPDTKTTDQDSSVPFWHYRSSEPTKDGSKPEVVALDYSNPHFVYSILQEAKNFDSSEGKIEEQTAEPKSSAPLRGDQVPEGSENEIFDTEEPSVLETPEPSGVQQLRGDQVPDVEEYVSEEPQVGSNWESQVHFR